jgi:hypothetical protein
MNDITLATLIEEKFRAEILPANDKRKYIENDWLIDEILKLLKKHPPLKDLINIDEMSISQIIDKIEKYFKKINSKRKLNKVVIINFARAHPEFRTMETLIFLMVLGFSFFNMFKRMSNNQKKTGDILEVESNFEGVTCNVHYNEPMPKQSMDCNARELYELIENVKVPNNVIQSSIDDFEYNEEIKKLFKKEPTIKLKDKKLK